ncbi:MAG: hypothetical protein ABWY57_16000 [Mycetocola sp.]
MKVKIHFPIDARNRKAVREQLLLDTTGSGVEDALFNAAVAAKTSDQDVYVSRGYGKAGRLSVWIVDSKPIKPGDGGIRGKKKALRQALARVSL